MHFNDSLNAPPNTAVGQEIADAIHYASDHIPLIATFQFDNPIPVELLSFTASVTRNTVTLNWTTATELNNLGFEIQRLSIENVWGKIVFVEGYGTTTETHNYSYVDANLTPGKYLYRLKQIDFDGQYEYSDVVEVEIVPEQYTLYQNYPNPFNPSTNIEYSIPSESFVELKVYDVLGNEVASLVNEQQQAGVYRADFTADNLPSGMYFARITANEFTQVVKMILLK
ncbi:MAG: T9SS type A sorting domain-containing protein [Bacteroidetes bacterium]|nr:T9SS type A sorting domain-containing protein [Bacteroidota bacterium]